MDFTAFKSTIVTYDYPLFELGSTQITVFALVKLAISALVLYLLAGRFSRWTLDRVLGRTRMAEGQKLAIMGLVHYTVMVVGAIIILQNAGINLTAFAIVGSALGVGVGFGLQNIISNFISGLIILLERPIQIGDRIELGGVEGVVREIGARRTTLVTPDQIAILVPNQKFITENVTNYLTLDGAVRLRVPVSIAAGQDIRKVEALLVEAARHADVREQPAPQVAMTAMTAASTGLELWIWYDAKSLSKGDITSRVYFSIVDVFAREEIKMA